MKALLSVTLMSLVLTGCGGGGQTSSLSDPAPIPPTAQKAPPAVPAHHYSVTDLAPIAGAGSSQANAVSNGQAAGYSVLAGGFARATFWHNGVADDLGDGFANAVNKSGQVAGYIPDNNGFPHATLWDHGVITDLGALSGFDSTLATGINDAEEIVGLAFSFMNPSHQTGFSWTSRSGIQAIASLANALAVNKQGQIAGTGTNLRAAIVSSQGTKDLGTLGDFSVATALNGSGHAAGYSPLVVGGPAHGFFFSGTMQDLGAGTGDTTAATGINDSDLVVGDDIAPQGAVAHFVRDPQVIGLWVVAHVQGSSRAYIWSATTGKEDLNALIPQDSGWVLATATAIDQSGLIVGAGGVNGTVHGYLLTPEK